MYNIIKMCIENYGQFYKGNKQAVVIKHKRCCEQNLL